MYELINQMNKHPTITNPIEATNYCAPETERFFGAFLQEYLPSGRAVGKLYFVSENRA
jgi:hypothetical protein